MMMLHSWARTTPARWYRIPVTCLLALLPLLLVTGAAPAQKASQKKTTAKTQKTGKKVAPRKASTKGSPASPSVPPISASSHLADLVKAYRAKPTLQLRDRILSYAAARSKQSSGALGYLAVGLTSLERNELENAIKYLSAAAPGLPKLADYIAYWLATANLRAGRHADALQALRPVWSMSPASPVLGESAIIGAQVHLKNEMVDAALELLRKHASVLPQPAGDALLASTYESSGDRRAAALLWQKIYQQYPLSTEAEQAAVALRHLREVMGAEFPSPSRREMLARVDKLISLGKYSAARAELRELIGVLDNPERDVARVRLGAIDYHERKNVEALRYLKGLKVSAPEADAERLYYIAALSRRLNNDDDLEWAVRELDRHHEKSLWRLEALVVAGNRFLLVNDTDRYAKYYRAAHESFPGHPTAAYGHWKVAWLHYMQRRSDAAEHLREHLKVYGSSEKAGAALYFLGRLAENRKKLPAALAYFQELTTRFPNSYYTVLARDRMAENQAYPSLVPDPSVRKFLAEVKFPERDQWPSFEETPVIRHRLDRARLFWNGGLDDWAETELRYGAQKEGPAPLLAMELASAAVRRGAPDEGIRYIKRLVPGYLYMPFEAAPESFWRLAFPMPYRTHLELNASRNGLDPYQLAALIRQESEFNAKAVSRAKAYGLTQVLPSTGRFLSRRVGISGFHSSMLFNPEVNLKIGSYYLKSLLDQFNGQWEPTLASYNAGKSRADSWLQWGDFREPAEFIETIPFTETREYVQIVLRNADLYRRLYASNGTTVASSAR